MSDLDLDQFEKLAARARSPVTLAEGGAPIVYLPEGTTIESVETHLPQPIRVKRTVILTTREAFISYFQEFKNVHGHSRIFADLETVAIVGILDDHMVGVGLRLGVGEAPEADAPKECEPMWGSHRALYKCPYSRQWDAWMQMDRRKVSQLEFAEWLEDRTGDVQEPAGTDLLQLCTALQIHRRVTYGSATRLHSGEFQFSFTEDNEAGTVEIPSEIKLGIPVFQDGTNYEVTARFRYRLAEGKLTLWYELVEPQKYVEDAFAEVVAAVASETATEVLAAKIPTA